MEKVSVIIPTKNSGQFIDKCLLSIKAQSYQNIELIVVDNFSSDNTPNIAKNYTDKFYQLGPERSAQRNYGVKMSSGAYVAIIDSDMELGSKVIESCVNKIRENNAAGVIIPEESFGVGFWAKCKKLERSFYVGEKSIEAARFFSIQMFNKVGGYDEDLVSGEDWDLSDRVEEYGDIMSIDSTNKDNFIYHNEGNINLLKTLKKKFYYASKAVEYLSHSKNVKNSNKRKGGIFYRYFLFSSNPKKLFSDPLVGIGMLFMKTLEFLFGGLGIIYYFVKGNKENK